MNMFHDFGEQADKSMLAAIGRLFTLTFIVGTTIAVYSQLGAPSLGSGLFTMGVGFVGGVIVDVIRRRRGRA